MAATNKNENNKSLGKFLTRHFCVKGYAWTLIIAWTAVVSASFIWSIFLEKKIVLEAARLQARISYQKDIIYRQWNAGHDRIYALVNEDTQPNPYLSGNPERDIKTPSGKLLTLINPSHMTRQAHDIGKDRFGILARLTSLNPIRPENAADPWERKALQAFCRDEKEVSSIEKIDSIDYMRLMRPLITERQCLKCHADQGYEEGDIRGGISVSIPMEPLWAITHKYINIYFITNFLLWLTGLGGIALLAMHLGRSERKRQLAEAKITRAAEEWRHSFDSITDFIAILDVDYKIIKVNRAISDFLYKKPVELIGKNCYKVIHGLEEPSAGCPHKEMLETKKTVTEEFYSAKHNLHLMITASPLFENDEIVGSVHYMKDITARKKVEKEQEKLIKEIEQKNKELEQMVYITSHDLRAPLVNIHGFTNEFGLSLRQITTLFENEDLSPDVKTKLGFIVKDSLEAQNYVLSSAIRMELLIKGLLQYSRAGRVEIDKEQIDMKNMIYDIFNNIEFQIKQAGAKFEITELPPCTGDKGQINNVFSNLIGNAIKYCDLKQPCIIKVSGKKEDDHSVYCVEDNGIGIAPEYHEKIFGIFHQLDPAIEGEGLGLTIVQRIIERHNGKIWLESEQGKGSRFYVLLPG